MLSFYKRSINAFIIFSKAPWGSLNPLRVSGSHNKKLGTGLFLLLFWPLSLLLMDSNSTTQMTTGPDPKYCCAFGTNLLRIFTNCFVSTNGLPFPLHLLLIPDVVFKILVQWLLPALALVPVLVVLDVFVLNLDEYLS